MLVLHASSSHVQRLLALPQVCKSHLSNITAPNNAGAPRAKKTEPRLQHLDLHARKALTCTQNRVALLAHLRTQAGVPGGALDVHVGLFLSALGTALPAEPPPGDDASPAGPARRAAAFVALVREHAAVGPLLQGEGIALDYFASADPEAAGRATAAVLTALASAGHMPLIAGGGAVCGRSASATRSLSFTQLCIQQTF